MLKQCPLCKGKIELVEKKILISVPNPGEQLLIDAKSGQCQKCGERYFNEEQADIFTKKIDEEREKVEGKRARKISSGTLII